MWASLESRSTCDGVASGVQDTAAPYALTWDTRTVSNGAHVLTARAYDTSGNATLSAPVTVTVSNTNYFQNEILATGFTLPTAIKFLPDGRLLVVTLAGVIMGHVTALYATRPDSFPAAHQRRFCRRAAGSLRHRP